MSSKIQLTGGAFQDISGNPLVKGYLLMALSQDALVQGSPSQQVASGRVVKITLDNSGNVVTSPAQYVWPNDALTPANTFYTVEAYTSNGELVWGPNSEQVLSSPSPYGIGVWKPNIVNVTSPQSETSYDISLFYPGTYSNGQVLLNLALERSVTFASNLVPTTAVCVTNPTAPATVTLKKNGTSFATIVISTSGVSTITSTGSTFNAGDILQIVGPATADATLAGVGIILSGVVLGN